MDARLKTSPHRARRWVGCAALAALSAAAGCQRPLADSGTPRHATRTRPVVYVDNYPVYYFTRRIAGDQVEVVFPAPPDVDPAFWMPPPKVILAYQQADLILLNGADYAHWFDKVSLPAGKVVSTAEAARDRFITIAKAVTHKHGPAGEHSHAGLAFTTWLDPELAILQTKAVAAALTQLVPDARSELQQNLQSLDADLEQLDTRLKRAVAQNPERNILASHPVYDYLARRYGIRLQSVHFEPNELPDDEAWKAFDELLARHPAHWMIWEAPPLPETVSRLKQREVTPVVYNPCGNVPDAGDFLAVMQENAAALERVFGTAR